MYCKKEQFFLNLGWYYIITSEHYERRNEYSAQKDSTKTSELTTFP